jgi:hypothetical protein
MRVTSARLNAMCQADQSIEDRIFELLGEMKSPLEIVRELDMDVREGYRLIAKVIEERDTPNAIRIREGIERFAAIRI